MKRALTSKLGWLFIVIGIVPMLFWGINPYCMIISFAGFYLRLIYNSEKYKYYKALNSELLDAFGTSAFQQMVLSDCLYGFYRGVVDLLAVVVLPFVIIPMLDMPWYCDWLIGIIYILAFRPVFSGLDETDKKQIQQIITLYGAERTRLNSPHGQ